jgi:hypothetical protein
MRRDKAPPAYRRRLHESACRAFFCGDDRSGGAVLRQQTRARDVTLGVRTLQRRAPALAKSEGEGAQQCIARERQHSRVAA